MATHESPGSNILERVLLGFGSRRHNGPGGAGGLPPSSKQKSPRCFDFFAEPTLPPWGSAGLRNSRGEGGCDTFGTKRTQEGSRAYVRCRALMPLGRGAVGGAGEKRSSSGKK
jgi:hypothetical protein